MPRIYLNRTISVCEPGEIHPREYEPGKKGGPVDVTDEAYRIAIEEGWGSKSKPRTSRSKKTD